MVERLSMKWAKFVSRGSRSIVPSVVTAMNGCVYILIYGLGIVRSEVLLGLGILLMYVGFLLFERAGMLKLMDEMKRTK